MSIDVKIISLNAISDISAGYPFRNGVDYVASGAVRVVQMRDVDPDGKIDWNAVTRTELPGRRAPDWLVVGDLLLVARGNRYYASSLDSVPHATVCGPHLFHLRLKPEARVISQFLAWQINQPPLQRVLRRAAEGSSQLSIRRTELEALQISVPSLSDQKKIVQLASFASRERDLLTSLIRNREQQLEALAAALTHPTAQLKD